MDGYRDRILKLIAKHRPETVKADGAIDLKAVSLAIGKNHAYMQQFIQRRSPMVLPDTVRAALANWMKINDELLRQEINVADGPKRGYEIPRVEPPHFGARDLPVYGTVIGGKSGEFYMNGQAHAYVLRPEHLRTVHDAYAVYVQGDSMEPAAYAGQLAYVNPHKPPSFPCLVVVQLKDGTALIKQYVRRGATKITLREFSPESRDLTICESQIKDVHRIVLIGDDSV